MMHPLLENTALLRLSQIIGRKATRKVTALPALIPVSKTKWWKGVRSGEYPQPVKIGPRCTAWRAVDVYAVLEQINARAGDKK